MSDDEVFVKRFAKLERILRKLRDVAAATWEEYSNDEGLQDRAERNLQIAAQICIDIGNHLIAINGFRPPESYSDIFVVLREEGIISEDLAVTFRKIAAFRNVLVHDYIEIDQKLVFDCLQHLDAFRAFVQKVTHWLYPPPGE